MFSVPAAGKTLTAEPAAAFYVAPFSRCLGYENISLLPLRLNLNLGTMSGQDEWSARWRGSDFASDAYALALAGGDGFVGSAGLRPEGYEIEHPIRFRLIEIEGYGNPRPLIAFLRTSAQTIAVSPTWFLVSGWGHARQSRVPGKS